MGMTGRRMLETGGIVAVAAALLAFPALDVPAFYVSFLYIVFFWISLATSWTILSGFAGYWSFGHAAFFGTGLYVSATLATKFGVPYLWTLPAAAGIAALLGTGIGFVVFRLQRLRGELFALLTISVTFVVAAIISNTGIDGGAGVNLMNVHLPEIFGSPTGTIYLLGLGMAALSLWTARRIFRSRLGLGLLAIHDDEDVAEVKGVPTFNYKLAAFAISSGIAGAAGGVHAIYVGYVTVGETFEITVTMYPVVMSILGGAGHWLGPALGATLVTTALYGFASGPEASLGRAGIAVGLIVVVLLLPGGVMPSLIRWWQSWAARRPTPSPVEAMAAEPIAAEAIPCLAAELRQVAAPCPTPAIALDCRDVCKTFGGVQALKGVDLAVQQGEILGLVGPNGSGKSTLINVVTGHYGLDRGTITVDGARIDALPAHSVARIGIARTYQIPRPFNRLSVLDNVALAARFGPLARGRGEAYEEAAHWLGYTGLARRAADLPGQLNLHERKFLELARALAAQPRILLLDEVLSGLNHTEIDAALRLIRDIRDGGTTIVFVEHLMRAVVELSDRVAVLNDGAVIAIGAPRETMREAEVVKVYLGKAHAS